MLLPAAGGFPFGRRPKVLLVVGVLFVRVRSARNQAQSACHIARRRRILIRPKAERFMLAVGELFVWARSARSQARSACHIARRRRVLIRPKAERSMLAVGEVVCLGAKRP